jgi:predicted nucleic acid-binding protein
MVIVDTSVWIDYFNGASTPQTIWLDDAIRHQQIGLTSLGLCELLQGVRSQAQCADFLRDMLLFAVFEIGSTALAIASAENYRSLRRRGITIRSTIDCLIATFCMQHGHTLLHKDHDFDAFERHLGLAVLHP